MATLLIRQVIKSRPIFFGQVLSFLLAALGSLASHLATLKLQQCPGSINITSEEECTNYSLPPVTQAIFLYMFLWLAFGRKSELPIRCNGNSFNSTSLFFIVVALCDVEANALIVLSFHYGDLTTLLLLESSCVLFSAVYSKVILGRHYSMSQILSLGVAMIGFVFATTYEPKDNNSSTSGANPKFGAILCIVSSALYSASNVFQEAFYQSGKFEQQQSENTYFLGNLGKYGTCIGIFHLLILERSTLTTYLTLVSEQTNDFVMNFWASWIMFVVLSLVFYGMVSIFLSFHEAAFYNLSALTANIWGTLIAFIFISSNALNSLFEFRKASGMLLVFCGVSVYSFLAMKKKSKTEEDDNLLLEVEEIPKVDIEGDSTSSSIGTS